MKQKIELTPFGDSWLNKKSNSRPLVTADWTKNRTHFGDNWSKSNSLRWQLIEQKIELTSVTADWTKIELTSVITDWTDRTLDVQSSTDPKSNLYDVLVNRILDVHSSPDPTMKSYNSLHLFEKEDVSSFLGWRCISKIERTKDQTNKRFIDKIRLSTYNPYQDGRRQIQNLKLWISLRDFVSRSWNFFYIH